MTPDTRVLCFGELLMRLSCQGNERFSQFNQLDCRFGGAEANVAVALKQLGHTNVDFLTALPSHDLGRRAVAELRQFGLPLEHTIHGSGRLGLYFLEPGAGLRSSQVIYDRHDSVISKLEADEVDWDSILQPYDWFHWSGITPALSESAADLCHSALLAAERLGLKVSVDLNYRAKLWQYGSDAIEVMPDLVRHCDVIIGNEQDAERMLGIEVASRRSRLESCIETIQAVRQRFERVEQVALTMRTTHDASSCALEAVYLNEELYRARSQQIPSIVDRIGGGDAFSAALLFGIMHQFKGQQTVDFAVAASAFKHTIPGDLLLAKAEEIQALAQGEGIGRVRR